MLSLRIGSFGLLLVYGDSSDGMPMTELKCRKDKSIAAKAATRNEKEGGTLKLVCEGVSIPHQTPNDGAVMMWDKERPAPNNRREALQIHKRLPELMSWGGQPLA